MYLGSLPASFTRHFEFRKIEREKKKTINNRQFVLPTNQWQVFLDLEYKIFEIWIRKNNDWNTGGLNIVRRVSLFINFHVFWHTISNYFFVALYSDVDCRLLLGTNCKVINYSPEGLRCERFCFVTTWRLVKQSFLLPRGGGVNHNFVYAIITGLLTISIIILDINKHGGNYLW